MFPKPWLPDLITVGVRPRRRRHRRMTMRAYFALRREAIRYAALEMMPFAMGTGISAVSGPSSATSLAT